MPKPRELQPHELKAWVDALKQPPSFFRRFYYRLAEWGLRQLHKGSPEGEIQLERIRKILILTPSGLGNAVLFIPAFRYLRKLLPESEIWLLSNAPTRSIYESANYNLQRFLVREDYPGILGQWRLLKEIQSQDFDLCLRLFAVHGFWTAYLLALSKIPLRFGHHYRNERHRLDLSYVHTHTLNDLPVRHEVELNLELVQLLKNDPTADLDSTFLLHPEEKRFAQDFLKTHELDNRPYRIGFHLGSSPGGAFKQWSTEKYIALIQQLVDQFKIQPILFWGPSEKGLIEEVAPRIPSAFKIPEILPIPKVAALIKTCRGFVCNDTGLMHLSASLSVPTVGILGPTDPARARPYGASHGVARLDIECSPCYDEGIPAVCRAGNPYCVRHLTVEDVFQVVQKTFTFLGS